MEKDVGGNRREERLYCIEAQRNDESCVGEEPGRHGLRRRLPATTQDPTLNMESLEQDIWNDVVLS